MINSESANEIVDQYVRWLRANITSKQIEDTLELTTPFLDNSNDHIQIYVSKSNGAYKVSDDGDTIRELRSSGIDLKGRFREKIVRTVLLGLGINIEGDELTALTDRRLLPQKVHDLIQAIISIGDMYVLARPYTINLFKEDVESFLRENDVRFVPYVKLLGKSGIDQYFDFVIPESKREPERVVQAIPRPTVQSAKMFIMAWFDTYGQTGRKSKGFAFLNDKEYGIKNEVKNAFQSYEIIPVPWTERKEVLPALVN
ncbi:MAG: DUF1829 domain-containing protein [Thermoplasmatales archaeon]|nr:DUF1829 domain-containing protein [Thermoplasmatales archaeon]